MDEDLERKVELLASLTVRQRQVVKLVLDGLSNAQIAEALGRIERTVEEHLRAIYRHLGLEQYPPRSRRVGLVRDFYGAFQAFQLPGRGPAQTSGLIPAPEPEASAEEFIADAIASGSYPLVPVRVHDYRTGGSVIIPVPVSDDLRDDEPDVIEGTATVHESAELGWWTPFPDSGEDPDWRRERRLLVIAGVVVALAIGGFALRQHASPAASAATSQSPLSKQTASIMPSPTVATAVAATARPSVTPSGALPTAISSPTSATQATVATSAQPAPTPNNVLFQADFTKGFAGWTGSSSWKTIAGMAINDGTDGNAVVWPNFTPPTADYAVEADIQYLRTDYSYYGFGLMVRRVDQGSYRGGWSSGSLGLIVAPAGVSSSPLASNSAYRIDTDWHNYRLEAQANQLRIFEDGHLVVQTQDNRYLAPGQAGLWSLDTQVDVRNFRILRLPAQ